MIDLPVACSPCPNDLFILHAWVHGKLDSPYRPQIDIADVQTLNEWAVDEKYPLIKVSYGVLSQLKRPENYLILPTGSALGWNSGPLLVANRKIDREDVRHARVAVPGANTTARWLFDFFIQPQQEPIWCSYEEVFPLLLAGEVDAGVLIHETRFEYERYQMQLVADLGAEWERRYELPIPLGGFLLHRSMCDQASALIAALRSSLESAWKDRASTYPFLLSHSIEKDEVIIRRHLDLFVTQETHTFSATGRIAVAKLCELMGVSVEVLE